MQYNLSKTEKRIFLALKIVVVIFLHTAFFVLGECESYLSVKREKKKTNPFPTNVSYCTHEGCFRFLPLF